MLISIEGKEIELGVNPQTLQITLIADGEFNLTQFDILMGYLIKARQGLYNSVNKPLEVNDIIQFCPVVFHGRGEPTPYVFDDED